MREENTRRSVIDPAFPAADKRRELRALVHFHRLAHEGDRKGPILVLAVQ